MRTVANFKRTIPLKGQIFAQIDVEIDVAQVDVAMKTSRSIWPDISNLLWKLNCFGEFLHFFHVDSHF